MSETSHFCRALNYQFLDKTLGGQHEEKMVNQYYSINISCDM